jgi:flagellar basal body rod protein FlgG
VQDGDESVPWRVIVAQRAFEANAKPVTTFGTITQEPST